MSDTPDEPDDPAPYREPLNLLGGKLLTFRAVWYDHRKPEEGYTVSGIYTHVQPPEGFTFPFRLTRVFVYFQVWGDEGDYRFRIRLVRLVASDENDGEEEEIHLGPNGNPLEYVMLSPRNFEVTGLNYVDEVAFPIGPVRSEVAGLYEYQVWADGIEDAIARERVLARE
jgi:hypothetical protein